MHPLTRAQDNYEIQVYGSDLVDPAHSMVELLIGGNVKISRFGEHHFKPNVSLAMILFENIYSCRPVFPGAPWARRASNASNTALMNRMMLTGAKGLPTTSKRRRIGAKLCWAQGLSPMPSVIALVMAPKRVSSKPRVMAAQCPEWPRRRPGDSTLRLLTRRFQTPNPNS